MLFLPALHLRLGEAQLLRDVRRKDDLMHSALFTPSEPNPGGITVCDSFGRVEGDESRSLSIYSRGVGLVRHDPKLVLLDMRCSVRILDHPVLTAKGMFTYGNFTAALKR
ncbi:MAG: hypothetical protein JWQ71_4892 [Pedosphaera sp.]|nr:hypothetical protein [Pedosphaera sp.]